MVAFRVGKWGPNIGTIVKIAVRWIIDGHHLGYGPLGPPTGHHLVIMGMTHFHIVGGKIIDEWIVYDELSMLVKIKLASLGASASAGGNVRGAEPTAATVPPP